MRRPWVIVVVSFAMVMTVGGLAMAMPTILEGTDAEPAAAAEEPTPTTKPAPDEPATDDEEPEEAKREPAVEEPKEDAPPVTDASKEEMDTEPPHLSITWPENGEHVDDHKIRFTGVTEPGASVFAGKYQADVDGAGNWGIVLILEPGGNLASFRAVDAHENVAEASVKVFYDKPHEEEPEKEKPPPTEHDFWAKQQYGFCSETPPYDVFYGETVPGAVVSVTSAFGSGETVAGEKGGWEIKVTFSEAPLNEVFVVTVSSAGVSKHFEFVHKGEPKGEGEHGGGEDK